MCGDGGGGLATTQIAYFTNKLARRRQSRHDADCGRHQLPPVRVYSTCFTLHYITLQVAATCSARDLLDRETLCRALEACDNGQMPISDDELRKFALEVVESLYSAVRAKLSAMLDEEYRDAGGSLEFPKDELLAKADEEVRTQVSYVPKAPIRSKIRHAIKLAIKLKNYCGYNKQLQEKPCKTCSTRPSAIFVYTLTARKGEL